MKHLLVVICFLFGSTAFAQTVSGKVEPVPLNKTTFNYVEQMPEPGFDVADYIRKNLVYPRKARRKNIQGRVVVKFIVNIDGTLDSIHAVNKPPLGYGLEAAAVELIQKMPTWKQPGKQNGRLVRVYYMQPIMFKLMD